MSASGNRASSMPRATRVSARTYDVALMMSDGAGEEMLKASYDETSSGTYRLNEFGARHIAELDRIMALPLIAVHSDAGAPGRLLSTISWMRTGGGDHEGPVANAVSPLEERAGEAGSALSDQQAVAAALREYEELGYDTAGMQMGYLAAVGVKMLLLAGLSMALSALVGLVASRTGARIGYDLRKALFTRVVSYSEAEIGKFSAASLITRGTNDVQLVQNVSIMLVRMVLYAPILALGASSWSWRPTRRWGGSWRRRCSPCSASCSSCSRSPCRSSRSCRPSPTG